MFELAFFFLYGGGFAAGGIGIGCGCGCGCFGVMRTYADKGGI